MSFDTPIIKNVPETGVSWILHVDSQYSETIKQFRIASSLIPYAECYIIYSPDEKRLRLWDSGKIIKEYTGEYNNIPLSEFILVNYK